MSIYKRKNGIYYIDITTQSGQRLRFTTGTKDQKAAQELHDKLKHELWRQAKLGDKPAYTWDEACIRWLDEMQHKKTLSDDMTKIKYLPQFRGKLLTDLTRQFIGNTVAKLSGSHATKNRYLAFIRSVLNKCANEWEWLDKAPKLTMYKEQKRRIRWLKPHEVERLLNELPEYMQDLVIFSLCTGLRKSNVLSLNWSQIDLRRRVAWYHADETKSGRELGCALNDTAMSIIEKNLGRHRERVFLNSQGRPVQAISHRLWSAALKRAGIRDFRWHDLRHTWASWLVQSGVSLAALQEMGGWESIEMVQRYAHLSPEHLHADAGKIEQAWHNLGTQRNSLPEMLQRKTA